MDGWTLSTVHEPGGEATVEELLEFELLRIAGGAPGYPYVRVLCLGDPPSRIRIGDETTSVLCDTYPLLDWLAELPQGAPIGHPHDAAPGSVWRVLLDAAAEHQRIWGGRR
jgi:hypothetical protein